MTCGAAAYRCSSACALRHTAAPTQRSSSSIWHERVTMAIERRSTYCKLSYGKTHSGMAPCHEDNICGMPDCGLPCGVSLRRMFSIEDASMCTVHAKETTSELCNVADSWQVVLLLRLRSCDRYRSEYILSVHITVHLVTQC